MTPHQRRARLCIELRVGDELTISTSDLVHLVIDEICNLGKLEMADALFTGDYVNHGGLIPDLIRGPEAIKTSVVLYRSAFPAFQMAVSEVTTEKDAVVLRWVAHSKPPLTNVPVDGKRGLRGITRCRLRDGKIAESWTVWDSRAALVQLKALKRTFTEDRVGHVEDRDPRRCNQSGRFRSG